MCRHFIAAVASPAASASAFYLRLIRIGLIGIGLLGGFRRGLLVDTIVVIDYVVVVTIFVRHGRVIDIGRHDARPRLTPGPAGAMPIPGWAAGGAG